MHYQVKLKSIEQPDGAALTLKLPALRDEMYRAVEKIGIAMSSTENCIIVEDGGLGKPLHLMRVNLEVLNYLAKRLDSLTPHEIKTYHGLLETRPHVSLKDMVNLTYNMHCYDLIDNFEDKARIGRRFYLNEKIAVSTSDMQAIDGAAYFNKRLKDRANMHLTSYGIILPNGNTPEAFYDGENLPDYRWRCDAGSVQLTFGKRESFLYFPFTECDVKAALILLGAPALNETCIRLYPDFLEKDAVISLVQNTSLADALVTLNEMSARLYPDGQAKGERFKTLVTMLKPQSKADLMALFDEAYSFVWLPDIKNKVALGQYLFQRDVKTSMPAQYDRYIDYAAIADRYITNAPSAMTEKGLVTCYSQSQRVQNMLRDCYEVIAPFPEPLDTSLTFYMPLRGTVATSESGKALDGKALAPYQAEIEAAATRYGGLDERRGLMAEYREFDSISAKVKHYAFSIENIHGELVGSCQLTLNAPLDSEEIKKMADVISMQAESGWGKGFETELIQTPDVSFHLSYWSKDQWQLHLEKTHIKQASTLSLQPY